jgi:hypothetical protein
MQDMQRMAAAAAEMINQSGAPKTAENYNRAIQAVMRGEAAPSDGFDMNAQVDRVLQRSTGRLGTARPAATVSTATAPAATPAANTVVARADNPPATPVGVAAEMGPPAPMGSMPIDRLMEMDGVEGPNPYALPTRSVRIENSPEANVRRRGTINAAQPIAEDDPMGGMYEGNQPRQAVDVDNPTGLALGLMTAPLGVVGRAAMVPQTLGQRTMAAVQADRAATAAQAARAPAQEASRNLAQRARDVVAETSTQSGTVNRAAIEASRRGAGVPQAATPAAPTAARTPAGAAPPVTTLNGRPTTVAEIAAAASGRTATAAPKPRNMSAAQAIRRQNIANTP